MLREGPLAPEGTQGPVACVEYLAHLVSTACQARMESKACRVHPAHKARAASLAPWVLLERMELTVEADRRDHQGLRAHLAFQARWEFLAPRAGQETLALLALQVHQD